MASDLNSKSQILYNRRSIIIPDVNSFSFFLFFFFPFRYGVNDHILTHKLVQHAIQLPPSFDPIAPRKYNMIFLVSKEVCIPLFGICFVPWGFLLSALLVSTVAWWSPCWTSDWKVWVRVLLQSLFSGKTHIAVPPPPYPLVKMNISQLSEKSG